MNLTNYQIENLVEQLRRASRLIEEGNPAGLAMARGIVDGAADFFEEAS